jgi:hypothetical protein
MKIRLAIILSLALFSFVSAEMRMWTDADGSRFAGEFSKTAIGKVFVRDGEGVIHSIPMDSLPEAESKYVLAQVPPAVQITVRKKDHEAPKYEWSSPDYYTTFYSFDIILEKTSSLDTTGDLKVELFVIGQDLVRQSDDSFVLMNYSQSIRQLPPGKRSRCEITVPNVQFERYNWSTPLESDRGKEYAGYLIAVCDSVGRIIDSKISGVSAGWIKEDLHRTVDALRKLYAEGHGSPDSCHFREGFKKVSTPRVPWFSRSEEY